MKMANQMTITFNVDNQILSRTDTNSVIEKSKNYLFAEFTFSEDWDNTNKAIIFENNVLRYKVYLDNNNKCQVPNRIIRNDGFTISVIGEDSNDFVTITTNELYIGVGKSNATEDIPSYVEEIESETLDVTRHGEKYNIEIPSEYVTDEKLSQELENYVDNESLEETLEDYAKETDLSVYATKQELNGKSTVIPNPTMSGDEPNLEGAEIDGVKYKVGGGGGKLYQHVCHITDASGIDVFCLELITRDNTPLTLSGLVEILTERYTANTAEDFQVIPTKDTIYVSRAYIYNNAIRIRKSTISDITTFTNFIITVLENDIISEI